MRVIELAGIGPTPFAGMLLADLGCDVIRIDRSGFGQDGSARPGLDIVGRGRRSIAVDLKNPEGRAVVLDLVETADVLIEGFRPGVMERLGLGPTECVARNPRLVYGRMTGWGQDGPLAQRAGHDIDYIAITGALYGIGRGGDLPVPPLNLVGDLGGGAMFLVVGVLAAVIEAGRTGLGQVVDAAITDGTALLTNFILGLRAQGIWSDDRASNPLDTGAPYYEVYACSDGLPLAVGALEPQFYTELMARTGMGGHASVMPANRTETAHWQDGKREWAALFATRSRAEWMNLLAETDACVAPVLTWAEAPQHPHNKARGTFVEHDGVVQAAPAPRFDRTPAELGCPAPAPGQDTDDLLRHIGRSAPEIGKLRDAGAVS